MSNGSNVSNGSGELGGGAVGAGVLRGGELGGGDGRTFEQLMSELEAVTERLAAGDLGIEAAVELYEQATQLHAQATDRLNQVRAKVEGLAGPGLGSAPTPG